MNDSDILILLEEGFAQKKIDIQKVDGGGQLGVYWIIEWGDKIFKGASFRDALDKVYNNVVCRAA